MEILPTSCSENLKRYWRRRRYHRLRDSATTKRKLKIIKLGGVNHQKVDLIPELQLKISSPIKLLSKFHDAYVDVMIGLACNVGKISKIRLGGERIAKSSQVLMVSTTYEEVDSKLVLDIYARLAASRQLSE